MPHTATPPDAPRAAQVRQFVAGWGAMDFDGHLANTAYLRAPGLVELSSLTRARRVDA
jgi:hypothetical protein